MPISGLTIKQDATSLTVVGGTDISYTEDGVEVTNGKHVSDVSEADFTIRPNITVRNRNPSLLASGQYSKAKRSITIVIPKKLADDSTSFNLVRMEIEIHPESTAAEVLDLVLQAAQLLSQTDTENFINYGSIA
jgi:RNA-binding protein YlmH